MPILQVPSQAGRAPPHPRQATKLEPWAGLRGLAQPPRPALDEREQTVFEKEA